MRLSLRKCRNCAYKCAHRLYIHDRASGTTCVMRVCVQRTMLVCLCASKGYCGAAQVGDTGALMQLTMYA